MLRFVTLLLQLVKMVFFKETSRFLVAEKMSQGARYWWAVAVTCFELCRGKEAT
jgi:hypothetical protein